MPDDTDDDLPIAEPPKAKKEPPMFLILPLFLLIVAGAVYGITAYVALPMFSAKVEERDGKGESAEAKAIQELANVQKFEVAQLVTNLSSVDGRYIRVGFTLEGTHPSFQEVVEGNQPRILNTTIGVLQTLTVHDVAEGSVMNRIRYDLVEHINRSLEPAPHVVENLYFSEFVIQ